MRLVISRSIWRKVLVMTIAMVSFVFLYEGGTFDSLKVGPTGVMDPTGLTTGIRHLFTGTAYCKGTTTASGVNVRTGIAASDPGVLPVGSVVNISTGSTKYNGVYTIMDTGPKVQGRQVDIYMWSCNDALAFGRQQIELTVLRLGWNPGNSVPSPSIDCSVVARPIARQPYPQCSPRRNPRRRKANPRPSSPRSSKIPALLRWQPSRRTTPRRPRLRRQTRPHPRARPRPPRPEVRLVPQGPAKAGLEFNASSQRSLRALQPASDSPGFCGAAYSAPARSY
jgi:3D (Asp-Asp-Asp) domain-containing protein